MNRGKEKLRVDKAVKEAFPGLTNRQIDEAISQGLVTDNLGKRVAKGEKSKDLNFEKLLGHLNQIQTGNPQLKISILEEHKDWLAIDKPAGIPGHPISLFDFNTVTHWMFAHYPEVKANFSEYQPILTPHRLDTDTSGILIVAKTKESYELWRSHFSQKKMTKKYLAWCWGVPSDSEWECDFRMEHDPKDERKMRVGDGAQSLPAQSQIKVLLQKEDKFLCEVTCETGVTHQVRVHLSNQGYPLVGDKLYDSQWDSRQKNLPFHQLRAVELRSENVHIKADATEFKKLF